MTILVPLLCDIRPLRAHCTGAVVVAGERRWPEVLEAHGLDPAAAPAAVAFAADPFDHAAIRAFATTAVLRVVDAGDAGNEDVRDAIVIAAPERRERLRRAS
jgi:hypothetical protein